MDWMKIGSALLLIAMIAVVFPRVRDAVKHGEKGSSSDWMTAILPLLAVALFIGLLIAMV
jgi:hypothetical protein